MSGKARKMPSQSKIADYWMENMPEHLYDGQIEIKQCWACGFFGGRIERAHILPRCEGGSDDEQNLHLLCRPCHQQSEALSGERYWDWYEQKLLNEWDFGISYFSGRICAALKHVGLPPTLESTVSLTSEQMKQALAYLKPSKETKGKA